MKDFSYIDRMREELIELEEKLIKMDEFMAEEDHTKYMDSTQNRLFLMQYDYMQDYKTILDTRIIYETSKNKEEYEKWCKFKGECNE